VISRRRPSGYSWPPSTLRLASITSVFLRRRQSTSFSRPAMDSRPPQQQPYSPPPPHSAADMRFASPSANSRHVPPSSNDSSANHPSASSSGYYPPPPAPKQHTIQIPFAPADPFRISRPADPFLPGPQTHQRRESSGYNYNAGRDSGPAPGARDGSSGGAWPGTTSASGRVLSVCCEIRADVNKDRH
jgi:hypothetical protein